MPKARRLSFSSRRKKKIIEEHKRLNLFELKREITKCQNMLLQIQKTEKQRYKTYKTMLISSRFCFEAINPISSRFLFDIIGCGRNFFDLIDFFHSCSII